MSDEYYATLFENYGIGDALWKDELPEKRIHYLEQQLKEVLKEREQLRRERKAEYQPHKKILQSAQVLWDNQKPPINLISRSRSSILFVEG